MERICPFLALSDDGRAVVDGYDAAHRCRSTDPSAAVDRQRQLGSCLVQDHLSCDRFTAALEARAADDWPAPAPDALIVQTRLVLPSSPGRRLIAGAGVGARGRRWLVGGGIATLGVAAVASGVAGSLGALSPAASASATPEASIPTARPTPAESLAVGGPASAPAATAAPTLAATPTPSATPLPTAQPTSAPIQPQTYVVQPGDTLFVIASRFGTTVEAIQAANGLASSDVILVGQVLIIP